MGVTSDALAMVLQRLTVPATRCAICMSAWQKWWWHSFGLVASSEHRAAMAMAMVSLVGAQGGDGCRSLLACCCAARVPLPHLARAPPLQPARAAALLARRRCIQLAAIASFTRAGKGGKRGASVAWSNPLHFGQNSPTRVQVLKMNGLDSWGTDIRWFYS
jgi:hypothetical protein